MKKMLVDLAGLGGLGMLAAGLHVQFGLGVALICTGCLVLVGATRAAQRGG